MTTFEFDSAAAIAEAEGFDPSGVEAEVERVLETHNENDLEDCLENLADMLRDSEIDSEYKGTREEPGIIRMLIGRVKKVLRKATQPPLPDDPRVAALEAEAAVVEIKVSVIDDKAQWQERQSGVGAILGLREHARRVLVNEDVPSRFKGTREEPGRVRVVIDRAQQLLAELNGKNALWVFNVVLKSAMAEAEKIIHKNFTNLSHKLAEVREPFEDAQWAEDELGKPHFEEALDETGLDLREASKRLAALRKQVNDLKAYLASAKKQAKARAEHNKTVRRVENQSRRCGGKKKS